MKSNMELVEIINRDNMLKVLVNQKIKIYEIASPRMLIDVDTCKVEICYSDEVNKAIKEIDKVIEFRIEQIKNFYNRE